MDTRKTTNSPGIQPKSGLIREAPLILVLSKKEGKVMFDNDTRQRWREYRSRRLRIFDGSDIKYLLEKRGYSLSDVGCHLGVTPQAVHQVIWGLDASQRIVSHIERLLGMKPGTIAITKSKRTPILKAA